MKSRGAARAELTLLREYMRRPWYRRLFSGPTLDGGCYAILSPCLRLVKFTSSITQGIRKLACFKCSFSDLLDKRRLPGEDLARSMAVRIEYSYF